MPATLEQAREAAADFTARQDEILASVDHLLAVHDAWEADPKAPDVPSEAIEQAILAAIETCTHGGIPAQCRELCMVAIPRLRLEWEQYAEGISRRPDGTPVARFWAAFRFVIEARRGAVPFVPKRPEPVDELLRQGVSHDQIGRHIYGYRGKGPFMRPDGLVDIKLIQQEAKQPGSVIPETWIHPAEAERMREFEKSVDTRLAAATARENDQTETTVDRMSIEDFLMQGADPNIIANVKGIPVDDVYKVARRLQDEGLWPPRKTDEPEASAGEPTQPAGSSEPDEDDEDDEDATFDAVAFIAENHNTLGVPEIVAVLKENGVKMTAKAVAAQIAKFNKDAAGE